MSKMFKFFIGVVVALAMIPLVVSMSDTYNIANNDETFTAVQDIATDEVVTLIEETPVDITDVTVEGVSLVLTTEYTVSGANITVLTDNSETGDEIIVFYTYEMEVASAVGTMVDLIPLLVIISVVVMGALAIRRKK